MPTISPSSPHLSPAIIDVFWADDRPALADLYCRGQADTYRRHPGSVAALRTVQIRESFVVLARTADGSAVGGMRIHLRCPGVPLPVERALGAVCPIGQAIAVAPAPLVELCGTWVDAHYRGTELAAALTSATLAVARALGARQIVGCAHHHIFKKLYGRFGAVIDPGLGTHPYPDPRYQTCVFWADPFTCPEEQAVEACVQALRRGERLAFIPTAAKAA